jgi:UDP-2,4-diacetamido-2,4,6-trideoxy-beta-L-altropyranose hydrolase
MKVIFRADGNTQTGLGHIMRSAALMHMLLPEFDCEFWTRNPEFFPNSEFENTLLVRQLCHEDIVAEAKEICRHVSKGDIIVLDGYHFDTAYQKILKEGQLKVVCIDDIISFHFYADAIINHAGGIDPELYSTEPYTRLFLGPAFALVKPVFYKMERPERDLSVQRFIISLGGADINNDTDKVLQQLIHIFNTGELHVVLGAANKHADSLLDKYQDYQFIRFHRNLNVDEIASLMQQCTYAVLTPSTICYEYMAIGGAVFLLQTADNQKHVKAYFLREGLAFPFEEINAVTKSLLHQSLAKQEQIFDRKSAKRVLDIFHNLATEA